MKFLIFLVLLYSCDSPQIKITYEDKLTASEIDSLTSQMNYFTHTLQFDKLKELEGIIIIPIDAACNSCRDKAVNKLTKNRSLKKRAVVVSGTSNESVLAFFKEQNNEAVLTDPNVIIDSSWDAFYQGLIGSKPTIYYLDSGKIYSRSTVTPRNIDSVLNKFFN